MSGPKGGRPPGRRGKGGVGPGPGYRAPATKGRGVKSGGGSPPKKNDGCPLLLVVAVPLVLFYALPRLAFDHLVRKVDPDKPLKSRGLGKAVRVWRWFRRPRGRW